MKEIKIFTIRNPETATHIARFLEGNKINFMVDDYSYNCFDPIIIFKCEMNETEERIVETLIKYYERKTEMNILPCNNTNDLPTYNDKLFNQVQNLLFTKFHLNRNSIPEIKELVFNDPATIIFWEDGTKTIVKTQNGEPFDKEKGFCMAVVKKLFGNKGNYYNIVDEWINKKAKIYDYSSKKKSNKTYNRNNEITKKE